MFLVPYKTRNVLKELDSIFDDFRFFNRVIEPQSKIYSKKNKDNYEIALKAPGFSKDEIKITVDNGTLTITGKKESNDELKKDWLEEEFEQSVTLPNDVNTEKIQAKLENGILSLIIPIAEASQLKQIEIK